jgi:hypothetical protein
VTAETIQQIVLGLEPVIRRVVRLPKKLYLGLSCFSQEFSPLYTCARDNGIKVHCRSYILVFFTHTLCVYILNRSIC